MIYFIKCNNLIFQQAAVQAQQLAQSRAAQADSPLHIESDNSDDVSNNKRYDDIEDWEIPPKELILKINQQVGILSFFVPFYSAEIEITDNPIEIAEYF